MLSLCGERLPPAPSPPKKKRSGYATTIMVFFAHSLILEYLGHHQNSISSSLYYPGALHTISSRSIHNFLSNVVHRQTNKLTNQCYQNITSFANEVIIMIYFKSKYLRNKSQFSKHVILTLADAFWALRLLPLQSVIHGCCKLLCSNGHLNRSRCGRWCFAQVAAMWWVLWQSYQ